MTRRYANEILCVLAPVLAAVLAGCSTSQNVIGDQSADDDTDTGAGADADSDVDTDTDTDGDTDGDSDSDSDSDSDADADTDTDVDSDVDTDTETAVLLLKDNDDYAFLYFPLLYEGYAMVDGGWFWEWDGVEPSLDGVDVVLWPGNADADYGLLPAAAAELEQFVSDGGGLLRTEFAAHSICAGDAELAEDLMPVDCTEQVLADPIWQVIDDDHPLTEGLETSFMSWCQSTEVSLRDGAVAVIESYGGGTPLLSYVEHGEGLVVHINDTLLDEGALGWQFEKIYLNAVEFLAGGSADTDTDTDADSDSDTDTDTGDCSFDCVSALICEVEGGAYVWSETCSGDLVCCDLDSDTDT
jgi:hypothetical protein